MRKPEICSWASGRVLGRYQVPEDATDTLEIDYVELFHRLADGVIEWSIFGDRLYVNVQPKVQPKQEVSPAA